MKLLTKYLSFALVATVLGVTNSPAAAAKLYKWTDADGNVSYQDKAPPLNSKSEILKPAVEGGQPARARESSGGRREPVVVYTLDNCNSCEILMLRLKQMDVPAEERSLKDDRAAQMRILDATGSMTAPSVFIGGDLLFPLSEAGLHSRLGEAGYELPTPQSEEQEQQPEEAE